MAVGKIRQVTVIFPPDFVVARSTTALKAAEQFGAAITRTYRTVKSIPAGCNVTLPLTPRQSKKFLVTL